MTQLPLRSAVSAAYPNPSNAVARTGFGALWDAVNEALQAPEIDVVSAATTSIGAQVSRKIRITGTTGITSFGTTYVGPILIRMGGILTITHNATTLRCPGSSNLTTAVGDVLMAWPTATTSGVTDGWQVAILSTSAGGLSADGLTITGTKFTATNNGYNFEIGSTTTSGSPYFDFHSSGANIDHDVRIQATGGTGAVGGGELFFYALINRFHGAVRPNANNVFALGTDTMRWATLNTHTVPAGTGTLALTSNMLGTSQTWQNMTASRAVNTNYTNSTGKAIMVNIVLTSTSIDAAAQLTVAGVILYGSSGDGIGHWLNISAVIPNGATYNANVTVGTASIASNGWTELR